MAFRTGTPIDPRLAAIDFQPLVKASAIQEQANVELANAVSQASLDYLDRQKKKQEDAVNVKAIEEILGVSEGEAKAILKNPAVQALYKEKLKAEADVEAAKLKAIGGASGTMTLTESELNKMYPRTEFDYTIIGTGQSPTGEATFTVKNISPFQPPEGQFDASLYDKVLGPAIPDTREATTRIQRADSGIKLLEKGVKTGFGEQLKMQAKNLGQTIFGLDVDISDQELFRSTVEPTLLDFISRTKGAVSDREFATFGDWSAGISKTPQGNIKILKFFKKLAEREVAVARFANELLAENPSLMATNAGMFRAKNLISQEVERLAREDSIYDLDDSAPAEPKPQEGSEDVNILVPEDLTRFLDGNT